MTSCHPFRAPILQALSSTISPSFLLPRAKKLHPSSVPSQFCIPDFRRLVFFFFYLLVCALSLRLILLPFYTFANTASLGIKKKKKANAISPSHPFPPSFLLLERNHFLLSCANGVWRKSSLVVRMHKKGRGQKMRLHFAPLFCISQACFEEEKRKNVAPLPCSKTRPRRRHSAISGPAA